MSKKIELIMTDEQYVGYKNKTHQCYILPNNAPKDKIEITLVINGCTPHKICDTKEDALNFCKTIIDNYDNNNPRWLMDTKI